MPPPLDLAAILLPARLAGDSAIDAARSRLLRAQEAREAARAEHDDAETAYLRALLAAHGGSVTDTAKTLGVPQPSVSRWIASWGIGDATRGKAGGVAAARAKKKKSAEG